MDGNQLDIEDFIPTPDGNQLRSVEGPINQAAALMRQIDGMETALKQMTLELQTLNTKTIPEAMASAGVSEFRTTAGVRVKLHQFLSGSLPKSPAARAAALEWIHAQNADDLIKWGLSVELDKGDTEGANRTIAALRRAKVAYTEKQDIHAQTLCAFARERLRNGEPVPLELLGLYAGTVAKVDIKQASTPMAAKKQEPISDDYIPHLSNSNMPIPHRTVQSAMPAAPRKKSPRSPAGTNSEGIRASKTTRGK